MQLSSGRQPFPPEVLPTNQHIPPGAPRSLCLPFFPPSFRTDLTAYPPDYFVCVPLVLDTLHSKVRTCLGCPSAAGPDGQRTGHPIRNPAKLGRAARACAGRAGPLGRRSRHFP